MVETPVVPAAAPAETPAAAPAETPAATPAGEKPFLELIPESFRDKPWAKENSVSAETFFKFVDNQNTLVGKKGLIVPDDNSPKEAKDKFARDLGWPEKPEEYDLTPPEEFKANKRDAEFEKGVRKLFHDTQTPKPLATKLSQGFERMIMVRAKADMEENKKADAAFEKLNTEFFGDKKAEIVANAQKLLRDIVPEEVKPALDRFNPDQLAAVIAITDSIYKKFGREDGFRGGAPANVSGDSYDSLSAQQKELMKDPAYSDVWHPKHAEVQAKNRVLMEKMRAIKK